MTTLGLVLFCLLVILTLCSIFFMYKYITSVYNSKYFLFFLIFGAAIISTLFLIPKTSTALISQDEIIVVEKQEALEKNKIQYEKFRELTDKERIKNLKKESKQITKEIKKNPDENKQKKLDEIKTELDSIPNIKSEMKTLKKNIKKQTRNIRYSKFSLFIKNNSFVIFICFASLILILFVLYIIGTIKKPAMIEEYKQYCKELEIENKRKREEEKRRKEEKRIEQEKLRKSKILEIANYFYVNNIKYSDVQNAALFIDEYDKTIKSYSKILNQTSKVINTSVADTVESFFEGDYVFGERRSAKKEFKNTQEKLSNYEKNNKSNYLKAKAFLSALPDNTADFCEKYGAEIINCINEIHNNKENEKLAIELEEEQKKKKAIEEQAKQKNIARQNAIEQVAKETKIREEQTLKIQKTDKVTKAVRHLEEDIPILQNHVSKNKTMDFTLLSGLENHLDVIEDLLDYLPNECINNVKRCKIKLDSVFDKCENKNDIQADVQIIKESFEKILSKE